MSSIRKVFWRGGFALALVPVAFALVVVNAPAPVAKKASLEFEISKVELRDPQVHEQPEG